MRKQVFLDQERSSSIINNDRYKYQLLAVLRKFNVSSAALEHRLSGLTYGESDILGIISIINNYGPVTSKYARTRVYAGLGMNYSKTSFSGQIDFAGPSAVTKSSYSPMLRAGVDVFANPATGKMIYRLDLSLWSSKGDVYIPRPDDNGFSRNVSFNQYAVSFTPQGIYNMYNSQPLKAFVGGGIAFNYSTFTKNTYYVTNNYGQIIPLDPQELNRFAFSLAFTAGIVLNKRVELSAVYILSYSIASYSYYSIQTKMVRAGLSYFFGR